MIVSQADSIMSVVRNSEHPVLIRRKAREWSQAELAGRAGVSRAAVSAIEGRRLTPSVAAALSLAAVLECSVEDLFGSEPAGARAVPEWAWEPRTERCRYWVAEAGGRRRLYPVEALSLNPVPHDGVSVGGRAGEVSEAIGAATLTLACCDPASGLLATEYARASGFRLLVFERGGTAALDLLGRGLIHVAGLHRSTVEHPDRNAETVRARLGEGYRLLRVAQWEEGVVLPSGHAARSPESLPAGVRRWAAREPGSAARECLDELLGRRRFSGREVGGHGAVAEAVHSGWAQAGVCVRLSAEEAGLNFLPLRREALDFCYPSELQHDPRIRALVGLLHGRGYRRLLGELPGYDSRTTGDLASV